MNHLNPLNNYKLSIFEEKKTLFIQYWSETAWKNDVVDQNYPSMNEVNSVKQIFVYYFLYGFV